MATDNKLKIGLDYHGVIDKKTDYFAKFCSEAKARNHLVYIITGGPKLKVEEALKKQNIQYDFVFAISDYYQALGKLELTPDGTINIPEYLWNIAKADFCRRNNINFHIDDSIAYLHWFSTPFCFYDDKVNKCYLSPGIVIDFLQPINDIFDKIEQISANLTSFSFCKKENEQ